MESSPPIDNSHSEAQARAAALEARGAFSPEAAAETAPPPPSAARAEAPWLVGPYAAAAAADRFKPAQSAMDRTEGFASPGRWRADPAGQRGNGRLLGFLAVYVVAAVCLIGWGLARWLPGVLRETALRRPSPAVQSLLIRAWQAEKSAHPDQAERLFRQALQEARVLGDQPGEAMSLSGLGYLSYEHKQPRRVLEYLQPALALYRQLGDKHSEADTLNTMGLAYSDLRQPRRALEYLRPALAAGREAGDKRLEAEIVDSFGMVYEAAGQPQRALPYYRETLARARQIGDKEDEALEIKNIARLQRYLPGRRRAVASAGIAPAHAAPLAGARR